MVLKSAYTGVLLHWNRSIEVCPVRGLGPYLWQEGCSPGRQALSGSRAASRPQWDQLRAQDKGWREMLLALEACLKY